jgi:hypothetical protein
MRKEKLFIKGEMRWGETNTSKSLIRINIPRYLTIIIMRTAHEN